MPAAKARSRAGTQLLGSLDELAVSPERFDDGVVTRPRSELGCHRVAVEGLHRVLLEGPDAVVAHHRDDVDAVAGEGVELHAGEPERAVPDQQHDLPVGAGQLGRQGIART